MKKIKKKMTKREAERFIKKVLTDKEVLVTVTRFTDPSVNAFGAWILIAEDNCSILVKINTKLNSDIRCLLLHEVGHFEGKKQDSRSIAERELGAQVWGIKRAKKLGWNNISKEMEWHLRDRWTVNFSSSFKWNSCYRRYILASNLAKKRGIV